MKVVLKAKNLTKTYQLGETKLQALKGINLEIEKGYFYSIIGKSGSGKSTLLHLLSGFDRPTKGKVLINNIDIHKIKDKELSELRRKKIGFVFQSYNLLPEFCVEENIKMPLYLDHIVPNERFIKKVMKELGIINLRLKFPSQLSGGEQQRVAIARALAAKPSIIFADEPTGNLDQQSGRAVLELFQYMREVFGQTILLVTHDLDIANQADRIIRIQDGKIV